MMYFTSDRANFLQQMRDEFASHGETADISDPPSVTQVRRLFRFLRGRAMEAIYAYESYANIFYIHRGHTSDPGDVVYPGGAGDTCDSWAEIMATRVENSRHIIDCEAYAYMGAVLLREAGFRFIRYINVVCRDWFGITHFIAELQTSEASPRTVFVSNDTVYNSLRQAVESVGFSMQSVRFGYGRTLHEATDEAYWIKVRWRMERIGDALMSAGEAVQRSFVRYQMYELEAYHLMGPAID